MLPSPQIDMNDLIFGSLGFMRQNASVFRKYYFLPLVFSIVGLFAEQVPVIGTAAMVVCQSISLSLVYVSVSRFYYLRDADQVADGAQVPFARVFFFTFMMGSLTQVANLFDLIPEEARSIVAFGIALYLWFSIKLIFSYPALALDEQGTLLEVLKRTYGQTTGHLLKIIFALIICYLPAIFFIMMLSNVVETQQLLEHFWANIPHLIFVDVVIMFCVMWFTLVMARLYEAAVLNNRPSNPES